jgi:hypothetical protein
MTENVSTKRVKSRRRPALERRRRRALDAAPEQLCVTLSIPQHVQEYLTREWIVRISTRALLLHTLYARGVCPTPAVETLRSFEENNETKRRTNPMDRKFFKFGGALHGLLEEWTLLCGLVGVERVLITLGPSWSRQKERHILDFGGLSKDDFSKEATTSDPGLGQEHALSRRVTRALLNGIASENDDDAANAFPTLSCPSPAGSSFMVHLSMWITREAANVLFSKSLDCDLNVQTLLQSLILRPDFTSTTQNASKRKQPHVVTAWVSSSNSNDVSDDWKEENGVWLTLPTSLKGFRI